MGQARRRGTFEERKAMAIAEGRDKGAAKQRLITRAKIIEEAKTRLMIRDAMRRAEKEKGGLNGIKIDPEDRG